MELGLATFADVGAVTPQQRMTNLIEEAALADELGQRRAVLSSSDPVRVFQEFAQVDLLSGGRAEIWAGRGSFLESFSASPRWPAAPAPPRACAADRPGDAPGAPLR